MSRYHLAYYLARSATRPLLWRRLSSIDNPLDASLVPQSLPERVSAGVADEWRVAFVGRPSRGKGFDKVCAFMASLQQRTNKRCVLHVFGDPGLYGTAHAADTDLHAYQPCEHHGNLSRAELYPRLAQCHFAVSGLSGSETFCLSLLEAAACGVVPVTVNSGGQISFLNRRQAIVADTLVALPEAVVQTARNLDAYERLVAHARALPRAFTPELAAENWLRALDGAPLRPRHESILGWFLGSRLLKLLRSRISKSRVA